jgi:hypothetical protein
MIPTNEMIIILAGLAVFCALWGFVFVQVTRIPLGD